jgi:hypothetical protein
MPPGTTVAVLNAPDDTIFAASAFRSLVTLVCGRLWKSVSTFCSAVTAAGVPEVPGVGVGLGVAPATRGTLDDRAPHPATTATIPHSKNARINGVMDGPQFDEHSEL